MKNNNGLNDIAKYIIKDSIFTNMFKIKKYARQLYIALHPEDTSVKEDDIFSTGAVAKLNYLLKSEFLDKGYLQNFSK